MYEQAGNIVERDYNPNSGLAPAPADSSSTIRAQVRFARNGSIVHRSLASPAAAAETYRWAVSRQKKVIK